MKSKKNLLAILGFVVIFNGSLIKNANAFLPVIDTTNLIQSTTTAISSVSSTATQAMQYALQVKQYYDQVKSLAKPLSYLWGSPDSVKIGVEDLQKMTDKIVKDKKKFIGNLKVKDVTDYKNDLVANESKNPDMVKEERQAKEAALSKSQKDAYAALEANIQKQAKLISDDISNLQKLQRDSQGAEGETAMIGYTNQFASKQVNQLLQIRNLLALQEQARITKAQADLDTQSRQKAADDYFTSGKVPVDKDSDKPLKV